MSPAAGRLLVDPAGDPAWNMALDEALLQLGGAPTLRLYGWSPFAVSLGYFQRLADFGDVPATTPIVRRLTGGGAIHHADELTFALALDRDLLPNDVAASYRLLHDAAVRALADSGIAAERLARGASQHARPSARWCFAEPGQDDVVTAVGKLLGSAQRRVARPRPRLLHHGSLVLGRPALTPFVAAVRDEIAFDDAALAALRRHLADRLGAALGCRFEPGAPTADEIALAEELRTVRYGNPEFTSRS
ncbi:MAG: hypothetical protein KDE27_05385 [Planctomycetes bacterium]|nr:hypothetical protein [Planctomycetota bacterium]